jgi:hypothetical protein
MNAGCGKHEARSRAVPAESEKPKTRTTSDELDLREKARELLRSETLSGRRPGRLWGGTGLGGIRCTLCGVQVGDDEVLLEVEFRDDTAEGANPHFHVRCFSALELELHEQDAAARAQQANGSMPGGTGGEDVA